MAHTWYHDTELDGGILDIDEAATPGPSLKLLVVVVGGCRVAALWLTEEGRGLGGRA